METMDADARCEILRTKMKQSTVRRFRRVRQLIPGHRSSDGEKMLPEVERLTC